MPFLDRSKSRSAASKVVRPFAFFRAGNQAHASAANRPILVLEEVYKYFRPDMPTLRGVNLSVERGEFVFITGPSGAGKSTLLSLIYRGQTVDEGRILFTGRDVARLTASSVPFLRRNLGVVFQDFKIIGHWTVFENVAVALEILSMPRRLVRSRVSEALERVEIATEARIGQASRGTLHMPLEKGERDGGGDDHHGEQRMPRQEPGSERHQRDEHAEENAAHPSSAHRALTRPARGR